MFHPLSMASVKDQEDVKAGLKELGRIYCGVSTWRFWGGSNNRLRR